MEKYVIRTDRIRLADILFKIALVLLIASLMIVAAQIFMFVLQIVVMIAWVFILICTLFIALTQEWFINLPNAIHPDALAPAMKVIPYLAPLGYLFLIISLVFYIVFRKDYRCKNKIIVSSIILGISAVLFIAFLLIRFFQKGSDAI